MRTVQKRANIRGWLNLSEQKDGTRFPRFYAGKSTEVKGTQTGEFFGL